MTDPCDNCKRPWCADERLLQRTTEAIIDHCLPEPFAGETKKWLTQRP